MGFFCKDGSDYENLKNAIYKLKLNDASLYFEPENSPYLGFGFRCGFLGILHLDIIRERLKREYNVDIIITYPSVAYQIKCKNSEEKLIIKNPFDLPDNSKIEFIEEPMVDAQIIVPQKNLGNILELIIEKRGEYKDIQYLFDESTIESASKTVLIHANVPLSSMITDFYDKLKSFTSGYGSLSYQLAGYKKIKVVRLDIVIANELVEALSSLVLEENVYSIAKSRVEALKKTLKRQQFEIRIQGVVGGKIIASERLAPFRKDVTAKLYGGDYTRKMKLLEKQKKGKTKMKSIGAGSVDIPQESFLAVFKI